MRSLGACYQQFSIYFFHYMSKFQFVAVSFMISVIDKVQFFLLKKKTENMLSRMKREVAFDWPI